TPVRYLSWNRSVTAWNGTTSARRSNRMDLRSWPAKMGVAPGDRILLMADVTRLAWSFRKANARFKPEDLIDAFLALLGPEGTLIVPTFNFDLQPGENFDLRRTPTITGALGNAALAHHAFARTG